MEASTPRSPGLAAVAAGLALIAGSFLPWEHSFPSTFWPSSHSGLDCSCGGGITVAVGTILMGLGSPYLGERHPWLPGSARRIAWVPTIFVSLVAAWLVTILWADVRDDESTVAVGFGVYLMAAGAVLGLIAGVLMRARRDAHGMSAEPPLALQHR
jgi:hypothetical protein